MRELTVQEINEVSGGVDWAAVGAGAAVIGLGAVVVGTAGIATVPAALVFSAATVGELMLAGFALAAAGAGGYAIGYGLCQ